MRNNKKSLMMRPAVDLNKTKTQSQLQFERQNIPDTSNLAQQFLPDPDDLDYIFDFNKREQEFNDTYESKNINESKNTYELKNTSESKNMSEKNNHDQIDVIVTELDQMQANNPLRLRSYNIEKPINSEIPQIPLEYKSSDIPQIPMEDHSNIPQNLICEEQPIIPFRLIKAKNIEHYDISKHDNRSYALESILRNLNRTKLNLVSYNEVFIALCLSQKAALDIIVKRAKVINNNLKDDSLNIITNGSLIKVKINTQDGEIVKLGDSLVKRMLNYLYTNIKI